MDNQWSPNLVLAWVLWIAGVVVIVADLFCPASDDIGHVGIALVVGGAIFNNRELCKKLRAREREAFDIGHRAGRDSVRSIR